VNSVFREWIAHPDLGGRWDENLPVLWAGSYLSERVRVSFHEQVAGVDLRRVLAPHISSPYRRVDRTSLRERHGIVSRDDALCFEMRGRCIALQAAEIALYVSGTSDSQPDWDHGQQEALLRVATEALGGHIDFVGTERWTDTPFEEPPERVLRGTAAATFLEALLRAKARLTFDLDYFAEGEAANPDVLLELSDRLQTRVVGVRPRNARQVQLIDPGTYQARAVAPMYSMPWWAPWALPAGESERRSRMPVWCSPALQLALTAHRVYRIALGVPRECRVLSEQEQLLFSAAPMPPSFRARENLYLRLLRVV
jgi:hypothetical protein